jgi:hypothetical protein
MSDEKKDVVIINERSGPTVAIWAAVGSTGPNGEDGIIVYWDTPMISSEEKDLPYLCKKAREVARPQQPHHQGGAL